MKFIATRLSFQIWRGVWYLTRVVAPVKVLSSCPVAEAYRTVIREYVRWVNRKVDEIFTNL